MQSKYASEVLLFPIIRETMLSCCPWPFAHVQGPLLQDHIGSALKLLYQDLPWNLSAIPSPTALELTEVLV